MSFNLIMWILDQPWVFIIALYAQRFMTLYPEDSALNCLQGHLQQASSDNGAA